MLYPPFVRSTRWLLAPCALAFGLTAGCSHDYGPATSAYVRECESICAGLAGQVRDLPKIAAPSKPTLAQDPTEEQQRVFDGLLRIYPLYVNQYHGAVLKRCQAISEAYGQALDRIAAVDAAKVDPAGVQLVTRRVQLLTEQRDFYAELHSFAAGNQMALVNRKKVDELDELLVGVFSSAISGDTAAVVAALKDVSGPVAKRQDEAYKVGDEAAKLAGLAAQLERDTAAYQADSAQMTAGLQAKYPGHDFGAAQPRQGAPGH